MKWFKHYYNASYSVELNEIIDKLGIEGYGRYWLFLELLTEKYDGESTKMTFHFEEISRKVRIKFTKKLETFMQLLPKSCVTFKKIREKVYEIDAPILLELKDRDFKKARKERAIVAPKIKNKIKNKNKNKIKTVSEISENHDATLKLIESWNSLNIIKHKINDALVEKINSKLKSRLKKNNLSEIVMAIKNYNEALSVGWFSYKWTLWDFIGRESSNKFYPDEYVRENYIDSNSESSKLNDMASRENPYSQSTQA